MSARPLLLGTAASLLACACSLPGRQAPASDPRASDFEATIARIGHTDPGSPAVLSAQLAYVEFLLSGAPGPCAERLERAQEQLGSVDANPKARVMFPGGWARVAGLEYRLHLSRAACGSEADHETELRTAVAAARRAVELYCNVFDYRSMVIMQFDLGTVLHRLGENAQALAALEAALDMDREYGFQDDAAENYEVLLTWRGEPAGDAQIAEYMHDFPKRRAILKFGWRSNDAQIALESHRKSLQGGQIAASRAAATFEGHITASSDGWSVSYEHRLTRYEPGIWPTMQGPQTPQMVFARAQLPAAGFKVSATGEFEGVAESTAFAARLAARTEELIRAGAPSGDQSRSLVDAALRATAATFSPGMLEAAAAENYQLETAMWIGARLEQGAWYEISAPLSLPGVSRIVVQHRIEFAFTRRAPCTAGAAEQACVEIVIRATPDKEALDQVIADTHFTAYTASTEARIVTYPATGTLVRAGRARRISSFSGS
jgi:tetratricopeptide (TPR) repeat protein